MSLLFKSKINFDKVLSDSDLDEQNRRHLSKVYATLGLTLFTTAIGSAAHVYFNLGGILSTIATIGLMCVLGFDKDKDAYVRRIATLGALGFFQGCSLGPLVERALHVDPSILVTAFLATTTIFVCFSISAYVAQKRSYLYLGGVLSSALSVMFLLSVLNMFIQSAVMSTVHLYMGLFIFCGYILFDTQMIMEKVQLGDTDFVWHAVELFIDFIAIFVRIVIILLEATDKKSNDKDKEKK